jgi:hypothetical protein
MQHYRNLSGDSGVTGYKIGVNYILVQFRTGKSYRYSYAHAGRQHVERMKLLATAGRGLSTYISQYVHDRYDHEDRSSMFRGEISLGYPFRDTSISRKESDA